jgi:hypothetical protein
VRHRYLGPLIGVPVKFVLELMKKPPKSDNPQRSFTTLGRETDWTAS